ncbi:hypothetical protein K491DRAFT_661661 [Lophiostoma macrostomum CBS 122681]|uniref:Uncharacterized protein n=1 Tax=Lophiostoma macrostomum CBS 122681 TaxID=1314788 RepID=A0A6A6T508_9PLEO|nr:hypothetical protein K491DRAFT_661661 [Lophiostoma macrostomum CBS 122681]
MRSWGTSSDEIIASVSAPLFNAWIVNLPQILLSFCYLGLNSICTSLASAEEWNLARTRKALRVTRPQGQQRSTYFLQLPYRWALPLMITSGILHWLMSQSLFFVRYDIIDREEHRVDGRSKSACGFSRISLLVFLIIALVLVCVIGWAGLRGLKQKLPFANSCSLAISAACHPMTFEANPQLEEVKWGVVVEEQVEEGYIHCTITSAHTKKYYLSAGNTYR